MNVTKQQVFDAAWNGLKAQGFEQAKYSSGETCGIDLSGRRCAIVHANSAGDSAAHVLGGLVGFALMQCHELATSPADMERRLREFAAAHGLTVPGDEKPIPSEGERFRAFMAKVREPVDVEGAGTPTFAPNAGYPLR